MSYPQHIVSAIKGARVWNSVHAALGTGVWSAITFVAGPGVLIVGSKITEETLKQRARIGERPSTPAKVTSCSVSKLRGHAEAGRFHTVILVMDHINRGPKTWAAIAELIKDKRVLVVEGTN